MEKLNSCLSSENKDYEHVDRVVSNENRNILAPLPYEFAETACTERHVSESTENILKLLEPIISTIKLSSRPKVTPFKFRHGRKGVVRIASWNIERFDQEKADNPGVKEVICMTILEKGKIVVANVSLEIPYQLDINTSYAVAAEMLLRKMESIRRGKIEFIALVIKFSSGVDIAAILDTHLRALSRLGVYNLHQHIMVDEK